MTKITNKIVLEMQSSAERKNLNFSFIYKTFFTISNKQKTILFSETTPQTTSSPIKDISDNKFITNLLLKKGGFQILSSAIINTVSEAKTFIKQNEKCVIKPLHGIHGKGVTVGIGINDNIKQVITLAQKYDKSSQKNVLIEKFCDGIEYRLLTIGEKVFVTKKEPAFFVSTGTNTVQEQIIHLDNLPGFRIPIFINDELIQILKEQQLNLNDIPPKNQKIILKRIANLKSGSITTSIQQPVDKKFIKIGLSLSTYLNIDVVGIDIIIDKSGQIYILEINVDPGIRLHMEPTYGPHYNVCDEILDYFFN